MWRKLTGQLSIVLVSANRLPSSLSLKSGDPAHSPFFSFMTGNLMKHLARRLGQGCQMPKFNPFLSLDCARVEGRDQILQRSIAEPYSFKPEGPNTYRDRLKSMQILLSRTQPGPGRTGKQEQKQTSRNHIQAFLANLCTIWQ